MRESTPREIAMDAVKWWRNDPGSENHARISVFGVTFDRFSTADAERDVAVMRRAIEELVTSCRQQRPEKLHL